MHTLFEDVENYYFRFLGTYDKVVHWSSAAPDKPEQFTT